MPAGRSLVPVPRTPDNQLSPPGPGTPGRLSGNRYPASVQERSRQIGPTPEPHQQTQAPHPGRPLSPRPLPRSQPPPKTAVAILPKPPRSLSRPPPALPRRAPASLRASATAGLWLFRIASSKGVSPSLSRAFKSAPASTRTLITAGSSFLDAAQCKGVSFFAMNLFRSFPPASIPLSIRAFTTSALFPRAA